MKHLVPGVSLYIFFITIILLFSYSLYSTTKEDITSLKPVERLPSYTVVVYMAARNDLFPFAGRNIKQMQQIGSNERLKLFIQFDMHKPGQSRLTKRFFIDEKHKIGQVGPDLCMDSGDINSLIDCVKCAHEMFPSDELVIILWNHGTGEIEPALQRAINPSELFTYNPKNKLIELNRSVSFLDHITGGKIEFEDDCKGICIDDSSGRYLTNQQLREGLEIISKDIIKKKVAILACDACHMSGVGIMSPLKDYVEYFIGSQEVELGTGYNYAALFEPFVFSSLEKEAFACHFVSCFKDAYSRITQDFTHSAVNLSKIDLLEQNIDQIANHLIYGLQNQKNRSVKEALRLSRHKSTTFTETTYVDISHFFTNMLSYIERCELTDARETAAFKKTLSELLTTGHSLIGSIVIANTVGRNLQYAKGISIYFPETRIHKSYPQTDFALRTSWLNFLRSYVMLR